MIDLIKLIEELQARNISLAEVLCVRDHILVQVAEFESGLEQDKYDRFLNRSSDVGWESALAAIANQATQSWFSESRDYPLDFFIDEFLQGYCDRVGVLYRRVWDEVNLEVQS